MSKGHSKNASKIERYTVKAQVKLSSTKESEEPKEIIDAKARLKTTKKFTTDLETIAQNLYYAQNEESRLLTQLSDAMASVRILGSDDKYSIYMNNMGRVSLNIQEIQQMYLVNMKDQFLSPLTDFNTNVVGKCQKLKVSLKTKKGKYDIKKANEEKILKTQQTKSVNLQKVHIARSKSTLQLDELQTIRNDFIASVQDMAKEKMKLLNNFEQYMDSYGAYADIHCQNLKVQDQMHLMPPNINNKFGLDSDTEDINDNDETMSTFTDWGKSAIVVREGWIKKRGKVNKSYKKRWFKLFVNNKLIYLSSSDSKAKMKGHINLHKIVGLTKKSEKYIDINTKTRLWALQFETQLDRDGWYNAILETKGTTLRQTVTDFGQTFVDNYYNQNSYNTSTPLPDANETETNPFFTEENVNAVAQTNGMPPPPPMMENDSGMIAAESQTINDENMDETNPFFSDANAEGNEEKNETMNGYSNTETEMKTETLEYVNSDNETANEFEMGTQMKFIIIVDGVGLYENIELTQETFAIQIEKGTIVEGQYVNSKVIFLNEQSVYLSNLDVVTVPNQDTAVDDNFV